MDSQDNAMVLNHGFNIDALLEISRNNAISTTNLIHQVGEQNVKLDAISNMVTDLAGWKERREQEEMLSPKQAKAIHRRVNRRVYNLLGLKRENGKLTEESKRMRKVYGGLYFSRLWAYIKDEFDVEEYAEIPAIHFSDAKDKIDSWEPADGFEALNREAEENWNVNHPDTPVNEYLGRFEV